MFLNRSTTQVADFFKAKAGATLINPRHNIAPGQNILVCDQNRELRDMRWGMLPVGRVNARGRPVMETIINVRSETVFAKSAFAGVQRCLVPADGWYEWTGERRKKTAWRISRRDNNLIAFAAVCDFWQAPDGTALGQVATVTCPPSSDVSSIHDRMGVILCAADFETWLNAAPQLAERLMLPLDAGALIVEKAVGVDWSAA